MRKTHSELRNAECGFRSGEQFMDKEEMQRRTKEFALGIIRLTGSLPRGTTATVIAGQLLRSGTSVGANYRAACRAKSARDFISKMGTVEEEADECLYWMELLAQSGTVRLETLEPVMKEADELLAITVASIKTAKRHSRRT